MKFIIFLVLAVVISPPSIGDIAIYGTALPEETVCLVLREVEYCTTSNPYGFFWVFPVPALEAGDRIRAWGTYSGESEMGVMVDRMWLPVVRNE